MFHLLQPKYRSCDRCHGLQYLDAVDDCWVCLQCAQRNYILTEDEENERENLHCVGEPGPEEGAA